MQARRRGSVQQALRAPNQPGLPNQLACQNDHPEGSAPTPSALIEQLSPPFCVRDPNLRPALGCGGEPGQQPVHTYPAHGPPSHPAERSEGTEGQEVVEDRQGPGAQFQGGSGHTAQLSQPPPQGQLREVQPAEQTSVTAGSAVRVWEAPPHPRQACLPAEAGSTGRGPSTQPRLRWGLRCLCSPTLIPVSPTCPPAKEDWESGAAQGRWGAQPASQPPPPTPVASSARRGTREQPLHCRVLENLFLALGLVSSSDQ